MTNKPVLWVSHPYTGRVNGRQGFPTPSPCGKPKANSANLQNISVATAAKKLNVQRRHLTVGQRGMIATELANMKRTDTLKQGPRSSNSTNGVSVGTAAKKD